jgi:hypothetical protein
MDKRSVARHRVLKAGTIEFNGTVITCTIRNMSNSGAALDIDPVGVPEHFTLIMPADSHRMACHVVWRKEKRIGIAFE